MEIDLSALYIDTSSLLNVLLPGDESGVTIAALAAEKCVVVTPFAELEVRVQLRARRKGGELRASAYRKLLNRLNALAPEAPFTRVEMPRGVFETALEQHHEQTEVHLRASDRLHLAAMEGLKLHRLMTHDLRQGEAGEGLGFEVLTPL